MLIVGEPGTGKRHVARTIHQQGPGRQRPLIAFDCEALPAEILERELFGASGPDATATVDAARRPRLSLGEGSSLLIDEILSLPRDLQVRLVEALDPRVRLLATTTLEPEVALRAERLRPELYFALTTLVLRLAPSRTARRAAGPAQHLLERANERGGPQRAGFAPGGHRGPDGLRLAGEPPRAGPRHRPCPAHAHSGRAGRSPPEDLPATIRGSLGGAFTPPTPPCPVKPLDELLTEVERRLIETALRQSRSNKSCAAEILGISRPRLYRRIKELNLPDDESGEEAEPSG